MVQQQSKRKDAVDPKLMEHNQKLKSTQKKGADSQHQQQNLKNPKTPQMMNKHQWLNEEGADLKDLRRRQQPLKLRVVLGKEEVEVGHVRMHLLLKKMQAQLKRNKKMKKKKRGLTSKHICFSHNSLLV